MNKTTHNSSKLLWAVPPLIYQCRCLRTVQFSKWKRWIRHKVYMFFIDFCRQKNNCLQLYVPCACVHHEPLGWNTRTWAASQPWRQFDQDLCRVTETLNNTRVNCGATTHASSGLQPPSSSQTTEKEFLGYVTYRRLETGRALFGSRGKNQVWKTSTKNKDN